MHINTTPISKKPHTYTHTAQTGKNEKRRKKKTRKQNHKSTSDSWKFVLTTKYSLNNSVTSTPAPTCTYNNSHYKYGHFSEKTLKSAPKKAQYITRPKKVAKMIAQNYTKLRQKLQKHSYIHPLHNIDFNQNKILILNTGGAAAAYVRVQLQQCAYAAYAYRVISDYRYTNILSQ